MSRSDRLGRKEVLVGDIVRFLYDWDSTLRMLPSSQPVLSGSVGIVVGHAVKSGVLEVLVHEEVNMVHPAYLEVISVDQQG